MPLLALILSLAFAILAALHLYWGFGGQWGGNAAIPKKQDGSPVFSPGPLSCAAVALGLSAFAYLCLAHVLLVPRFPGVGRTGWLIGGMSGLFALRAVGDFCYVGLFKKIRGTDFAAMDTKFFTPLCAGFAAALAWLALKQ